MSIKVITPTDFDVEFDVSGTKVSLKLDPSLQQLPSGAIAVVAAGGGLVYDPATVLSGVNIPVEGSTYAGYANKVLADSNGATWVFSAMGVAHRIETTPATITPFLSPVLDFQTTAQLAALGAPNEGDAYIVTDGVHQGDIAIWDPAIDNGDGSFGNWAYYVPNDGDYTTVTTGTFANTVWYYDIGGDTWIQDTGAAPSSDQPRQPIAGNYMLPSEHSFNPRRGHWLIQNTDICCWGADPATLISTGDNMAQRLPHKASWVWNNLKTPLARSAQYAPKFVDVVGVYDAAIALDNNGKVWASTAQSNRAGLAGMNPAPNYGFVPVPFFQTLNEKVVSIHASSWQNHFLVVTELGKVYGTGGNGVGQLGNGTTTTPTSWVQFILPANKYALEAKAIDSMLQGVSLVLTVDGELYGAGYNSVSQLAAGTANQTTPVLVATNVKAYTSDGESVWVVKNDGTLWVRGQNDYGQLGLGNTINQATLVQVPGISDAAKVFTYPSWHNTAAVCLLTTGGIVKFAGRNEDRKFGITAVANNANVTTFTAANLAAQGSIKDVIVGRNNSTVLTTAGTVWNVGHENYRGLGKNSANDTEDSSWQQVSLPTMVVGIRLTSYYDGGGNDPESILALTSDARIYVWGSNIGNAYAANDIYSPQIVPTLQLDNGISPVAGPVSLMNQVATLQTLAAGMATQALDGGTVVVTFTIPYTADHGGVVGVAPTISASWGGGSATVTGIQTTIVAANVSGSLVFTATVQLPNDLTLNVPNTGNITYNVAFGALNTTVTGIVQSDPMYVILTGSNLAAYTAAAAGAIIASELSAAEVTAARAILSTYGAPNSAMVFTTAMGQSNNTVANTNVGTVTAIPAGKQLFVVGFASNTNSPVTAKLYDAGLTAGFNLGVVTPTAGGVHYYAIKSGVAVVVLSQVAFGGQPNQFYGLSGQAGQQAKFLAGNVVTALTSNAPAGQLFGFQGLAW